MCLGLKPQAESFSPARNASRSDAGGPLGQQTILPVQIFYSHDFLGTSIPFDRSKESAFISGLRVVRPSFAQGTRCATVTCH